MTGNEILNADLLDIVFYDRNKNYGAYTIRRFYNNRLLKALGLMIIFAGLFVLLLLPKNSEKQIKEFEIREVVTTDLPLQNKPEKPIQKLVQAAAPAVAQRKFTDNIKIENNDKVTELIPENKSLENVAIGNKTTDGAPGENAAPQIVNASVTSTGDSAATKENIFKPQESSPQFPGGQAAWMRFLSKYLVAPDELQAGEQKTVRVRFFVSEEGNINHFEVVQSAGASFDNEVIRVLQKMPKWKPAEQNGHPISVTFTQPVTFVGMED